MIRLGLFIIGILMICSSCQPRYDLVMIGDSITEGGDWQELLLGFSVKNMGLGGYRTRHVLARDYLQEAQESGADVVCVMAGINDLMNEVPLDTVISQYAQIIDVLSQDYNHIIIQSTLYQGYDSRREAVKGLNIALRDIAQKQGCVYLDLNEALAPQELLADQYTSDGLHLTDEAYTLWATMLLSTLAELKESNGDKRH